MTSIKQVSFAGGYLSRGIYGRSDQNKWQSGLAECRNFWINRLGNAENRPGTGFAGSAENFDPQYGSRIITFDESSVSGCGLEFGMHLGQGSPAPTIPNLFIGLWKDGARVTALLSSLSAYSQYTTYSRGQVVSSGGYAWSSLVDTNIGQTPTYGAGKWYRLAFDDNAGTIVKIVIPVPEVTSLDFCSSFTYAQINQVMFVAHNSIMPFGIERHSESYWRVNTSVVSKSVGRALGLSSTAGAGGSLDYRYSVVAVDSDGTTQGNRALATIPNTATRTVSIDQIVNDSPYFVRTLTPHGFINGSTVVFSESFADIVSGTPYVINNVTSATFNIPSLNGDGLSTHTTGTVTGHTTVIYNISSLVDSNPYACTTATAHALVSGDYVLFDTSFQGLSAGVPYAITVTGANTFVIPSLIGGGLNTSSTGIVYKVSSNIASIYSIAGGPITIVMSSAHTFNSGDIVEFTSTVPIIRNAFQYSITVTGSTTFTLDGAVGDGVTYSSNPGIVMPTYAKIACATPSATAPNVITWTPVESAYKYNVYRYYQGAWAFIGSTSDTKFDDINIIPNGSYQPSVDIPMFQTPDDYPAVVGIYQQRLWFGNTNNQPQSYWASRLGKYGVYSVSTPTNDSDAFTYPMAGRQRQFITSFVDIGKLIIHTTSGEHVANGDQGGSITPTTQNIVQTGYAGSMPGITPISIGTTSLFVQLHGTIIRDLQYSVQLFNYAGKDTTIFAGDLFKGKTIVDMCWQQVPDSIIWVVLSDGSLVGMTYIKEHEMWAWHRHDTDGKFVSATVVHENGNDRVYFLVDREYAGGTSRVVEFMNYRGFNDIQVDACFTDSSVTYNGINSGSTTMTVSTSGGWTMQDTLTITASSGVFASSDATNNNLIVLRQLDASGKVTASVRFQIISYTSATVVSAQALDPVPSWAQDTPMTSWGKAVSHFSGATNLSLKTINILGDGCVERSIAVGSDGSFVTSRPYLVVHAGLPITAQLRTMDWENAGGETVSARKKNLNEMMIYFVDSRGGTYGSSLTAMYPFTQPQALPSSPDYLLNGPCVRFPLAGAWGQTAQTWIQQTDPLPLCIAAIVASGQVGG